MKKIVKRKIAVFLCAILAFNLVNFEPFVLADSRTKKMSPATASDAWEDPLDGGVADMEDMGGIDRDDDGIRRKATGSNADFEDSAGLDGLVAADDEIIETISVPETEMDYDFDLDAALERLEINMIMPRSGDDPFTDAVEEAAAVVRQQMVARKPTVKVTFGAGSSEIGGVLSLIFHVVMEEAVKNTGVPNEGDYLAYHVERWSANGDVSSHSMALTYEVKYATTADEEEKVDKKVGQVLSEIKQGNYTDYEMTKQIYEWICNHVRYSEEEEKHTTAFSALINGKCACQGYSTLLYRLLMEEGIPCRIISGYGGDKEGFDDKTPNHCWNAIEMDGQYYYADVTWEQAYYQTKSPYYYFLHGSSDWDNHFFTTSVQDELAVSLENYPKRENIIVANPISYAPSDRDQIFAIAAKAQDDAVITYRSNSNVITVNEAGEVFVPAGTKEIAAITVTAAAIHDYEETTKIIDVTTGDLGFSFWENYDRATGRFENAVTSMDYAYGSFFWRKEGSDVFSQNDKLYMNVRYMGETKGDDISVDLTLPDGFSFQEKDVQKEYNSLLLRYDIMTGQYTATVEIYPTYKESYYDGMFLDITAKVNNSVSERENTYYTVPIKKYKDEGTIKLRNSFHDDAVGRDWVYHLNVNLSGFSKNSDEYNHQLAKISAALSAATYHNYTIQEVFSNLGFSNIKTCNYALNDQETVNQDQVACAFATKKYVAPNDNKIYTIVVVAIRGTVGDEWYSNFEIEAGNVHQGFLNAAEYVTEQFEIYLGSLSLDKNYTKLLITGHSRGAAVADLIANGINSNINIAIHDNIYAYTFAAPNSLKDYIYHDNVYNIINNQDLVAHVPGKMYKAGNKKVFNVYYDNDDVGYNRKAKKLKNQFDTMWSGEEYITWERPNILKVLDPIPLVWVSRNWGEGFADLLLGKKDIPIVKEFVDKVFWPVIQSKTNEEFVSSLRRIKYVEDRIWHNHAIETYIAWLETSDNEYELYTDISPSRVITIARAKPTAKTARDISYSTLAQNESNESEFPAEIVVYDPAGNVVARITNGNAADINGPYCAVDGDMAFVCLDDGEYSVKITGSGSEMLDIFVDEYDENGEETKLVDYLNVPGSDGETATLNVGGIPEASEGQYSLVLADGSVKESDFSASGDELATVTVSVAALGDGEALGGGDYTKGDPVTLYAIEGNQKFKGWYVNGEVISRDAVYRFICMDDLNIEARFTDGDYCEVNGHTPAEIERIEPTCVENGYVGGIYCTVCGIVLVQPEVIPATGHTVVIDEGVAPTETSTGLTEGSHCLVCGEVIVGQEVIPMLSGDDSGNGDGSGSGGSGGSGGGGGSGSGGSGGSGGGGGSGSGGSGGSGGGGGSGSGGGGTGTSGGINQNGPGGALKDTYENAYWVQNEDGTWMLMKPDNTVVKGWAVKSNSWYYLRLSDGIMVTGWISIDGIWYYLDPANGNMRTGWILVDNIWYYLDPVNGNMICGWVLWNGSWYYLSPANGAMVTGWQDINNKRYYFYPDGKMAANTTTPDGYKVDENGAVVE